MDNGGILCIGQNTAKTESGGSQPSRVPEEKEL